MSFPQQALSHYGKAWYAFIGANIQPTRHVSDVTRERATLLYAIVTGLNVDVGVLINESIKKAIRSKVMSGLSHPSLITRLCKRAGVQWEKEDVTLPPMSVIDHHLISRYAVWEGAPSHPRGEGFLLVPQPPLSDDPQPSTEAGTSTQAPVPPSAETVNSGALVQILNSLSFLQCKIDHVSQWQNQFHHFHAEFANILSNIHAAQGRDDADFMSFPFPTPLIYAPYPP